MSSVKLIATAIAVIVIASVAIILIQSNRMILLPGFRSSNDNNNSSKQNMATSKPSLVSSLPSSSQTISTNLQNKLSKGNDISQSEKIVQLDNSTLIVQW